MKYNKRAEVWDEKVQISIFYESQFIIPNQIILKPCSNTSSMNTLISHINLIVPPPRQTALTEARTVSLMFPKGPNTRQSHARATHFWVIAVTEINVSSPMEIVRWIRWVVGICTKRRNAKTFGRKDFVCMEFVVSFCIRNVRSH